MGNFAIPLDASIEATEGLAQRGWHRGAGTEGMAQRGWHKGVGTEGMAQNLTTAWFVQT